MNNLEKLELIKKGFTDNAIDFDNKIMELYELVKSQQDEIDFLKRELKSSKFQFDKSKSIIEKFYAGR